MPTFREYPHSLPILKFLDIVLGRAVMGLAGQNNWLLPVINSLSTPLTSYASYEWTRLRSWPKVCPHQVFPRWEENCIRESSNGFSRSKWLISSLSTHLMSYVSMNKLGLHLDPKYIPTKFDPLSRKIFIILKPQSGAVIMCCNITWYFILYCSDWSRI